MTSEMNALLERLQEAIDEAISASGRISDIVDEMRKSGHDLCLIVETSAAISPIGVSPVEDTRTPDFVPDPRLSSNVPSNASSNASASTGEMQLSTDDLAFLRSMKIAA
jgi:hypothetical protein